MSERVKWETEREIETAWFELNKIPLEEITDVVIQIIARNHSPQSSKQVLAALNENPGMLFKYNQPGRLVIDGISGLFAEHIAQQLVVKLTQKQQTAEMEKFRPQLEVAAANSFEEPPVNELSARRNKKALT